MQEGGAGAEAGAGVGVEGTQARARRREVAPFPSSRSPHREGRGPRAAKGHVRRAVIKGRRVGERQGAQGVGVE